MEHNENIIEPEGNGPSSTISKGQERNLWNNKLLGRDLSTKLMKTLFFLVGKFFGLRGGREQ